MKLLAIGATSPAFHGSAAPTSGTTLTTRLCPSGAAAGSCCYRLMGADLSRFPSNHRLLARDAPVIAGQRAAFAERAMARHYEGDRILSDRSTNGTRSLRAFDPGRDIRIADCAAHRDLQQR